MLEEIIKTVVQRRKIIVTLAEKLREEGRAEGRKEGRKEGIKEGKKETKRIIAQRMLELGEDLEKIKKVTGLSEAVIKELKIK